MGLVEVEIPRELKFPRNVESKKDRRSRRPASITRNLNLQPSALCLRRLALERSPKCLVERGLGILVVLGGNAALLLVDFQLEELFL